MIRVSDVFHHYGLRPVLHDVTFDVAAGQTLAIIGPNGTGKTTLLDLLAGLASPTEGMIAIDGQVRRSTVENELAIRQKTVFLPADSWFPADLTGRDFLLGAGESWGVPVRRLFEHADRLLSVFQMNAIADSAISGYSTGQRKKIGLCSALITEASILLLDEPFSGGLDPAGLTAMKHILKHLTERQDRTVVLTSPVPELVEEVADEVLILNEGTVLKHDTVENIKAEAGVTTLDAALRKLIFPETEAELHDYFSHEVTV
jgi:ABC-2 type transport system ATP-binding protein